MCAYCCNSLPVGDTCLAATFVGTSSIDTTLLEWLHRTTDVVAPGSIYGCNLLPVGDTRLVLTFVGTCSIDTTLCKRLQLTSVVVTDSIYGCN